MDTLVDGRRRAMSRYVWTGCHNGILPSGCNVCAVAGVWGAMCEPVCFSLLVFFLADRLPTHVRGTETRLHVVDGSAFNGRMRVLVCTCRSQLAACAVKAQERRGLWS